MSQHTTPPKNTETKNNNLTTQEKYCSVCNISYQHVIPVIQLTGIQWTIFREDDGTQTHYCPEHAKIFDDRCAAKYDPVTLVFSNGRPTRPKYIEDYEFLKSKLIATNPDGTETVYESPHRPSLEWVIKHHGADTIARLIEEENKK